MRIIKSRLMWNARCKMRVAVVWIINFLYLSENGIVGERDGKTLTIIFSFNARQILLNDASFVSQNGLCATSFHGSYGF